MKNALKEFLERKNDIAMQAINVYNRLVRNLHLNPETKEQMIKRLSEDRIANGNIVS